MKIRIGKRDALVVVDVQNDFCPGGALAVPEGDRIVPVVNRLAKKFDVVVATKDWHPADHYSFVAYGGQWPAHCVWETWGASFHPDLDRARIQAEFYKGFWGDKDDYSGFVAETLGEFDTHRTMPWAVADLGAPLEGWLKVRKVVRIFVAGLATDYCVKATVLDGLKLGFGVYVVTDAIAAVNVNPGDGARALQEMVAAGAKLCKSTDIHYQIK